MGSLQNKHQQSVSPLCVHILCDFGPHEENFLSGEESQALEGMKESPLQRDPYKEESVR